MDIDVGTVIGILVVLGAGYLIYMRRKGDK